MGGIIMLGGTLLLMIIGKAASFIDEKENKRKKTNEKDKSVIMIILSIMISGVIVVGGTVFGILYFAGARLFTNGTLMELAGNAAFAILFYLFTFFVLDRVMTAYHPEMVMKGKKKNNMSLVLFEIDCLFILGISCIFCSIDINQKPAKEALHDYFYYGKEEIISDNSLTPKPPLIHATEILAGQYSSYQPDIVWKQGDNVYIVSHKQQTPPVFFCWQEKEQTLKQTVLKCDLSPTVSSNKYVVPDQQPYVDPDGCLHILCRYGANWRSVPYMIWVFDKYGNPVEKKDVDGVLWKGFFDGLYARGPYIILSDDSILCMDDEHHVTHRGRGTSNPENELLDSARRRKKEFSGECNLWRGEDDQVYVTEYFYSEKRWNLWKWDTEIDRRTCLMSGSLPIVNNVSVENE